MLSRSQRVLIYIVSGLTLLSTGIIVNAYNGEPSGYVAVYDVVAMWTLVLVALLVGLALLIFRRTRFSGLVVAAAAVLIPFVFFVGVKASAAAGLNHWVNAPLVHFGPDVRTSLVVYYKTGVSQMEMSNFEDAYLYQGRSDGQGKDLRTGIRMFLRLAPLQAHGHDAFAVDLDFKMRPYQRQSLISSLLNSPLLFKVYTDVAPSSIPDPNLTEPRAAGKSRR